MGIAFPSILYPNICSSRNLIIPFLVQLINKPVLRVAVAPASPSPVTGAIQIPVHALIPSPRREEARARRTHDDDQILGPLISCPRRLCQMVTRLTLKNPRMLLHRP